MKLLSLPDINNNVVPIKVKVNMTPNHICLMEQRTLEKNEKSFEQESRGYCLKSKIKSISYPHPIRIG